MILQEWPPELSKRLLTSHAIAGRIGRKRGPLLDGLRVGLSFLDVPANRSRLPSEIRQILLLGANAFFVEVPHLLSVLTRVD